MYLHSLDLTIWRKIFLYLKFRSGQTTFVVSDSYNSTLSSAITIEEESYNDTTKIIVSIFVWHCKNWVHHRLGPAYIILFQQLDSVKKTARSANRHFCGEAGLSDVLMESVEFIQESRRFGRTARIKWSLDAQGIAWRQRVMFQNSNKDIL